MKLRKCCLRCDVREVCDARDMCDICFVCDDCEFGKELGQRRDGRALVGNIDSVDSKVI